jgi:hypothetical protein
MPSAALGMESLPPMMNVAGLFECECRSFQMRMRQSTMSPGPWWGWCDVFGDYRVCFRIQDPRKFELLSCAGMFPYQHLPRLNSLDRRKDACVVESCVAHGHGWKR